MASVPRGLLQLIALQFLSESSMSGAELQEQIGRSSAGSGSSGPGSIYFMIKGLREKELIVELPAGTGTTRRYSSRTRARQSWRKRRSARIRKQLELSPDYCDLAGDKDISASIKGLSAKV